MIDFLDRFLASMSETELDYIGTKAFQLRTAMQVKRLASCPETLDLSSDERAAVQTGNKIAAVKMHRNRTGLGLAESLAHVRAYIVSEYGSEEKYSDAMYMLGR